MREKRDPNAAGRFWKTDIDGHMTNLGGNSDIWVPDAAGAKNWPRIPFIEEERFVSIPPNSYKIISCSPIGSIFDSGMAWPLSHASISYELNLDSDVSQVLVGKYALASGRWAD